MKRISILAMVFVFAAVFFVLIFLLVNKKNSENIPEQTSMANPASTNCAAKGGELEMITNPDGSQFGMCNFEGYSCEEWALYRDECNIKADSEAIFQALVAKGLNLNRMKVEINKHLGKYISGSVTPVSEPAGGGYVFATKTPQGMKIVADGNGIISCTNLEPYPDFPVYLISSCVGSTGDLVNR